MARRNLPPAPANAKENEMFRKNVGSKERIARVVGGCLMLLFGLLGMQASPPGLAIAGLGLVGIVTGALRFCPACAIAGRKPEEP
jgi:hypothetical protein